MLYYNYLGISLLTLSGSGRSIDRPGFLSRRWYVLHARRTASTVRTLSTSLDQIHIADRPRQAAWYLGNCVANLISGVVVYGIGNITIHTIAQWQLIFLILGAITTSLAFWLVTLLPDNPKNAIFLNKKDRAIALQRTLKNKTGVMDVGTFKWNQVWMALKDPQTWFLVLYNFCVNLCNGGITSVCPTI